MSENKCIKYFAAHYCPYSNETSRTYHLINNLFKRKYTDVRVEVYWGEDINEDNKHEFENARAEYVPTITNSKYAHINLSLPEDYNKEGKTDDELTYAVLENIYNQLDKEKEDINLPKQDIQEQSVETVNDSEENNNTSKSFTKETFGKLNNNKFVGFIFISIILLLILYPFYKKYKPKKINNLLSESSVISK